MNIHAPEEVARDKAGETRSPWLTFLGGTERSTVEMRLDESAPWRLMERTTLEDPYYAAMKSLEKGSNPPPDGRSPRSSSRRTSSASSSRPRLPSRGNPLHPRANHRHVR